MQGPLQDSCHQVVTDSQPLNNYPQHALEVLLREYTEETISKGFIHSFIHQNSLQGLSVSPLL